MLLVAWTGLFKAKAELEEALDEKVRIGKSILIGVLVGAGILGIATYDFSGSMQKGVIMENLFVHIAFSGALMLLVAWTGLFKAKNQLEEALGEKVRMEKSVLIGVLVGSGILGIAAYAVNAGLPAVLIISGAMVYPCGSIMRALAFRIGIGLSALVVLSKLFGLNASNWIMVIVLAIIPGVAYLIGKYLEPTFDGWR